MKQANAVSQYVNVLIFAENGHSTARRYWETSVTLLCYNVFMLISRLLKNEPLYEMVDSAGISSIAFVAERAVDHPKVTARPRLSLNILSSMRQRPRLLR